MSDTEIQDVVIDDNISDEEEYDEEYNEESDGGEDLLQAEEEELSDEEFEESNVDSKILNLFDVKTKKCDFEDLKDLYAAEEEEEDDASDTYIPVTKSSTLIKTTPYLTKYEYTRFIAIRAQQLNANAPCTVPADVFPDGKYPVCNRTKAIMELKHKKSPWIVRRNLPNGEHVDISINKLINPFIEN